MMPPKPKIGQQIDILMRAAAESMLSVLVDHGGGKGRRLEFAIAHVGEIAAGATARAIRLRLESEDRRGKT